MGLLRLGELEIAYSADDGSGVTLTTTGDVAEILEQRYHVMGTFYERRKDKIAGFIADSLAHALQDRINGRSTPGSPVYAAEQQIEAEFRAFLDANEMQMLVLALTGAPISQAAAQGVSHRRKSPYSKKNPARPAFIDTGNYRACFRAVVKL